VNRSILETLQSEAPADVVYLSDESVHFTAFPSPVLRVGSSEHLSAVAGWETADLWPTPPPQPAGFQRAEFSGRGPTHNGLHSPLIVARGNHFIFSAMGENGTVEFIDADYCPTSDQVVLYDGWKR
jgi:hypothetical protein